MALSARTLTGAEAVARATGNNVQLLDATWTLEGSMQSGFLPHTTGSLDTAAIKAMPVSDRTPDRLAPVFRAASLDSSRPIAVYDRAGLFSAPWAWWMLGELGLDAALVEDAQGGVQGGATPPKPHPRHFAPKPPLCSTASLADVLDTDAQIVDARSPGRFRGTEPEPRPGLHSGHIPGSLNLPFAKVKSGAGYKSAPVLRQLVAAIGLQLSRPIITTCGSGVTASGLAFALTRAGARNVRVYLGSWAEYGASDHPAELGG